MNGVTSVSLGGTQHASLELLRGSSVQYATGTQAVAEPKLIEKVDSARSVLEDQRCKLFLDAETVAYSRMVHRRLSASKVIIDGPLKRQTLWIGRRRKKALPKEEPQSARYVTVPILSPNLNLSV